MSVIERFVVLLYDRTSNQVKFNQARQELFPKRYEKGFYHNVYFHSKVLCLIDLSCFIAFYF